LIGNGDNTYSVSTSIGSPAQTYKLIFSTGPKVSFVNSVNCSNCSSSLTLYNATASNTSNPNGTNLTLNFNDGNFVNGTLVYDNFQINGVNLNHSLFLAVNATNFTSINGFLGFPFKYNNDQYKNISIIDNFISEQKIGKRMVSIKINDINTGNLYLGHYPSDITNGNLPFTNCRVRDETEAWTCHISNLLVGNNTSISDGLKAGNSSYSYDLAYFSTHSDMVVAPIRYYEYINTTLFKSFIDGTNCRNNTMGMVTNITCNTAFVNSHQQNFSEVGFAFDNVVYRFNSSDLFVPIAGTNMSTFVIVFRNDTNIWKFGQVFLKNFITVFDSDHSRVMFYGANIKDYNSSSTAVIIVIAVGVLILILAVIFLIFFCKGSSVSSEQNLLNN